MISCWPCLTSVLSGHDSLEAKMKIKCGVYVKCFTEIERLFLEQLRKICKLTKNAKFNIQKFPFLVEEKWNLTLLKITRCCLYYDYNTSDFLFESNVTK